MTNMLRWWHPYIVSFVLEDFSSCKLHQSVSFQDSWPFEIISLKGRPTKHQHQGPHNVIALAHTILILLKD